MIINDLTIQQIIWRENLFFLKKQTIITSFIKNHYNYHALPLSTFENCVFSLLRHHDEVKYWQQKDGQEIDFVVDEKMAYKVKLHAIEQGVKKLVRRADKINIKKQFAVSLKHSDAPKTTYGFLL